jgi:hypothetical protein
LEIHQRVVQLTAVVLQIAEVGQDFREPLAVAGALRPDARRVVIAGLKSGARAASSACRASVVMRSRGTRERMGWIKFSLRRPACGRARPISAAGRAG